jgi:phage terminase large subunit GpA-like protein
LIKKYISAIKTDPHIEGITEWAEKNRYMPAGITDRPGMWRADFSPHLVEIQECLHPESVIRAVTVMKSTQSFGTTGTENAIGHSIKNELHNILFIISSLDVAKMRSSGAIDVLIDFSGLKDYIRPITRRAKQRKTSDSIYYKELAGGHRLLMTSYNSISRVNFGSKILTSSSLILSGDEFSIFSFWEKLLGAFEAHDEKIITLMETIANIVFIYPPKYAKAILCYF